MPQEHYRDDNLGWGCQKKLNSKEGSGIFNDFEKSKNKTKTYAHQAAFI